MPHHLLPAAAWPAVPQLPDWASPDNLRTVAIVVFVGLVVVFVLVVRFVQKLVMKATLLVVLAALGIGVWVQRAELGTCARTCQCRLFGVQVKIPQDKCTITTKIGNLVPGSSTTTVRPGATTTTAKR